MIPAIPAYALRYLRAAAESSMRSAVQVVTPSVPVYDDETGRAVGSSVVDGYAGPANIHPALSSGEQDFAGGMVEVNLITVSIPFASEPVPQLEDHVQIIATEDPALIGETLRVIGISNGGSLPVVRTLSCTFEQANPFDPEA